MSGVDEGLRAKLHDLYEKEIEKIRLEEFPPVDGRFLMRVPPRAGMMEFTIQRSAAERKRVRDIITEGVNNRVTAKSLGIELGNAFIQAMATELYRRTYREERAHPEWVDMGGES